MKPFIIAISIAIILQCLNGILVELDKLKRKRELRAARKYWRRKMQERWKKNAGLNIKDKFP